jgi:hypothetical protein
MASTYPTSLDSLTNPTVSDYLNSTTVPHATQHSDLNDAVENLQAKVGIDSSADTGSIDYKVTDAASRITTLEAGATADAIVAYADLSARTAANPSPSEGDVSWQEDTNRFDIYNGTAWSQVAVGDVTAFTPSWTNFTPGNATESWHYVRLNDWLYFAGATTLGSTSSVTGLIEFDFPVGTQLTAASVPVGIAEYLGGATYRGSVDQVSDDIRFFANLVSGSYIVKSPTSASVPFTWATGDIIRASGAVLLA